MAVICTVVLTSLPRPHPFFFNVALLKMGCFSNTFWGAVGDVKLGLPPGCLNTPLKEFSIHPTRCLYRAISTPKGRYVLPQTGVIVTTPSHPVVFVKNVASMFSDYYNSIIKNDNRRAHDIKSSE